VGPYTQYLWFKEDARHPQVFTILYETKSLLFVVFFVISLCLVYFNLRRALKVSMVYLDRPSTVGQVLITRLLTLFQDHGPLLTKIASLVLALLLSLGFSSEWMTYLLSTHAQPFHKVDPIFGMDLSYFVYVLPWQLSLVDFFSGMLVMITLITAGLYVGLQSMAAIGKIEMSKNGIRTHLSILIGITIVLFGLQLWLKRFQFGLIDQGQFIGAGYSAMHQLQVQGPLSILVMLVGIMFCTSPLWSKSWRFPIIGLLGCGVIYLIGLGLYPAILQGLIVNPNRNAVEAPYAAKAIAMTRYAYGLDKIEVKNAVVQPVPTKDDLDASAGTLDNMRLWDPEVLRQSIDALQGLKPYYYFRDVDIDRYKIDGKTQMIMLSPRDINPSGLSANNQNWVNLHLQYTHGFGVTMTPVNKADPIGQPEFIIKDIPPTAPAELAITQPRIYFSDYRNAPGGPDQNYVLVDTKLNEFDYPSEQNDQSNRWTGDRGINIGPIIPRLAFSIEMSELNMLISVNVTSKTRLLMHRGILDRASLIYPFLSFDNDPYMVIYQGRLLWILDGYTSTDQLPYSAKAVLGDTEENYARNPVKVVIDAYTGETDAYAIDPTEPILQTYEQIYPNLIKDKSQIPAGLSAHFRYPEDLFHAQAEELTQYHVTENESLAFLNNQDAWDLPTERGTSDEEEAMAPYFVQMRLPSDAQDQFLLILPFTPRQKGNMSGWLAAHCDPQDYGKLWLYEYPRGSILPGPKQMEANFNQNAAIANFNTLLKNGQSKLIVGNLLVMPIGNSVMYEEPMFLESISPGITAIPQLKKVVLGLRDQVVVADTYADALKMLFGNGATPTAPAAPAPTTNVAVPPPAAGKPAPLSGVVSKAEFGQLLQIANQADAALRAGDFAKYGTLQKQLKARLEALSK
jgi:hypothetical protein